MIVCLVLALDQLLTREDVSLHLIEVAEIQARKDPAREDPHGSWVGLADTLKVTHH